MNKISLKNLKLQGVEQLSREQLKNVNGGNVNPEPPCDCNNATDHCDEKDDQGRPIGCMAGCESEGTEYLGICRWNGQAG